MGLSLGWRALPAVGLFLCGGVAAAQPPAPPYHPPPPYYPPPPGYYPPPPPPAVGPPRVVYGWDPDVPPPDGYALDSDFNGALLGNGIGLLAGAYVISALTAAIASETQRSDDWTPLFVPVVGPFITIGTLQPGAGGMGLLIADGVFQVAGVIGIAMSFVDVEYKVFRTANVDVAPIVGPGVAGFSAEGSF